MICVHMDQQQLEHIIQQSQWLTHGFITCVLMKIKLRSQFLCN